MNKETRVLVFGIALMFIAPTLWVASVVDASSIIVPADVLGWLLFLIGLIFATMGAFDVRWSEDVKTKPRSSEAPGTTSAPTE